MIGTWNISIRHLRSKVILTTALLAMLVVQGCTLPGPEQWDEFARRAQQMAAERPRARVDISFDTFCVGEMGTITWDGGGQFDDCDPSTPDPFRYSCGPWGLPCEVLSNTVDCKEASLGPVPGRTGAGFSSGFEAHHLNGSASFTADWLVPIFAWYSVQWDGWTDRRAYQREVPDVSDRFTHPTGVVSDFDSATPITADRYHGAYRDILVCDEITHTWRFGRAEHSSVWATPDGQEIITSVDLSPCAAITQLCIPAPLVVTLGRLRISVEGGPSVVLGGEDDPRCTHLFWGYHPEDIRIEPLDRQEFGYPETEYGSPCTPGEVSPSFGVGMLEYDIGPSNLCASGPDTLLPGFWAPGVIGGLEFGGVELLGVSRDRCLAALDPRFLADLTVEAPGACFDSCDPSYPISCQAGLSCWPRVVGGDEYICYNTICNPDVTQEPAEQSCACGDGVCEQSRCSEFQQNCPADCGVSQPPPPQPAPVCGDGACGGGETCSSCSADCGPC